VRVAIADDSPYRRSDSASVARLFAGIGGLALAVAVAVAGALFWLAWLSSPSSRQEGESDAEMSSERPGRFEGSLREAPRTTKAADLQRLSAVGVLGFEA
jgi:hypothetical protein